ncbi:hypothetical protein PoB_000552400 [Plakobranchus ocellatus]|uniref:Uncharacterized protein n=1 Tax=Plakobranchus ocellatus TaxID=259542 RepID=A0AAV3Y7X3_9GAST|nr:hypothetical protein PoB_000552400 [Plakobranchus ocellatus]
MGRKDKTCPLAMRALSLETIARFGREYAIAYTGGSSTGGTGNGGYGIYFLWPDGSTTRKCGPVGEWTCSYEWELKASRNIYESSSRSGRKEPRYRAWLSLPTAGL